MLEVKISPSIMCCKAEEYKVFIDKFETVGLDSIHFDVMDGHYVNNIMLGTNDYKDIKRLSNLPVDVHLMCEGPEKFIDMLDVKAGDRISFHPETTHQPYKLLQTIKERGCKAGLVLNPGTPVYYLDECVHLVDYVTLMTVNPGFAGQTMVPDAINKIKKIRKILDDNGKADADLEVDGNTTLANSIEMRKAGANIFVVGTSSIVKDVDNFENNYNDYKNKIEEVM